ncbi:LTBP1 [Branchiostoma lanceolatum]|uniref:LTBP1 protein n=1 Tax=Branchiostoma lanceolatum TaxID=7740 RepID=A0A8J9VIC2_BRALA|nr:LTBP1 [Branchiostoma lanceolatum]
MCVDDNSIYAEDISGTWHLVDGGYFLPNSRVKVTCVIIEGCQTVRISGSYSDQIDRMTTYTMTGQLFDDRPGYQSSSGDFLYYYNQDPAGWHVGPGLGSEVKAMYLPNDTSIYADGTSETWYLSNGTDFLLNRLVRVSCAGAVVDGQWSNWGSWATCHTYCTCGDDNCLTNAVQRTRQCITPPPLNGGSNCTGDSSQERLCACLDIDECTNGGVCVNGRCANTIGSYNCTCNNGYRKNPTTQRCADIDECVDDSVCDTEKSSCTNTLGGYDCICDSGYRKNPRTQNCEETQDAEGPSTGTIVGISFGVAIPSVLLIIGFYYCKVCKRDGSVTPVSPEPSAPPPPYSIS